MMVTKNLRQIADQVIGRIVPHISSIKEELLSVSKVISSTFKSDMPHNKKREHLRKTLASLSIKSKVSLAGGLIVFVSFFVVGGGSVVADIESDQGVVCTSGCDDIEGLNLSDKTWANFKFSGVNFDDVTFDNVKFYGTKFENVTFTDAQFIFDQTLDIGELSNVEIKSSAIEVSNPPDGGQYFYIAGENISLSDSSLKGVSINLSSPESNVSFDNVLLQKSTVLLSTNELISSYQERLEGHFWTNLGHQNIKVDVFQNEPEKRNVNLDPMQRKGLDSLISELRFSQESKELAKITKIYVDECKISALENLVLELAECNKGLGAAVEAYLEKVNNVEVSIAAYSKEIRESIDRDFVGKAIMASWEYFKLRAYINDRSKTFIDWLNDKKATESSLLFLVERIRDIELIDRPELRKVVQKHFAFPDPENYNENKYSSLKWIFKPSDYKIPSIDWDEDGFCKSTIELDKIFEARPFDLKSFQESGDRTDQARILRDSAVELKAAWSEVAKKSTISEIKECLEVLPNLRDLIWKKLGGKAEIFEYIMNRRANFYKNNIQILDPSSDSRLSLESDVLPYVELFEERSSSHLNFGSDMQVCINSFDENIKPIRPKAWKKQLEARQLSKPKCGALGTVKDYFLLHYGYPAPEWVTGR